MGVLGKGRDTVDSVIYLGTDVNVVSLANFAGVASPLSARL
jgi:hypothetical protein